MSCKSKIKDELYWIIYEVIFHSHKELLLTKKSNYN